MYIQTHSCTNILVIIIIVSTCLLFLPTDLNEIHSIDTTHGLPQLLTSPVSGISWAMRTYLFVLCSSRKWAQFALVAPASPPVAAALWLGDKVAAAGCHLTHCLQHLCKAESLSVVWKDSEVNRQSMSWNWLTSSSWTSNSIGQSVLLFLAITFNKVNILLIWTFTRFNAV